MAAELTRALLSRYLRRFWHRAVAAGGRLDDLFVTLDEVRVALGEGLPAPAQLPEPQVLEARIAAARAQATSAGVARLRDRTGLAVEGVELLRVATTLQADASLLRASTFAWADFAVKQPTVGFLVELLADDAAHRDRLEAVLRPDAPLRRLRLVRLGQDRQWQPRTPLLHRPLFVPASVGRALSGAAPMPEAEHGAVTREDHGPSPVELVGTADERLTRVLDRCVRGVDAGPVVLVGPRGAGRRTVTRAHALVHGKALHVVAGHRLPAEPAAFEAALAGVFRDALLDDGVILYRADPPPAGDPRGLGLEAVAGALPVPVVISAVDGSPLPATLHTAHVVALDQATPATRRALFGHLLAQNAFTTTPAEFSRLADAYDLTAGDLDRALQDVRIELGDTPALDAVRFDHAVRRQVRTRLGDLATRSSTTQTWADLVVGTEQRVQIDEILAHARHGSRVFDAWGFGRKVGQRGRGLACLFTGPPGTGKTMTAALIAQALGLDLYQVDLSRVVDKYVGETEKNLARLFHEAGKLPVVLLFDEADALFATRTKVESSNDRYANLEINYLLQLMERHPGISVLTTNMGAGIDPAFMRRLRFRVHFPLPGAADRLRLWRAMIPDAVPLADDVDFDWLARRWEMSGALIRNAVVRAAFLAAEAEAPLDQSMLLQATQAELAEMGRLGAR